VHFTPFIFIAPCLILSLCDKKQLMKKPVLFILTSLFAANCGFAKGKENIDIKSTTPKSEAISFMENKGQIKDQNNLPNSAVLFSGKANEMNFHLKRNGISYQLYKKGYKNIVNIHRLDISWIGTNSDFSIEKNGQLSGVTNFYIGETPVTEVKSYSNITYSNIYENIDLKWYENKGELEYDFIVKPGGDYKKIKIKINGAEKININNKGELEMLTPFGKVIEKAPLVTEEGKILASKWIIKNGHIGFEVQNHNPNKVMIIDPVVRVWGTYYGGTGNDAVWATKTDNAGNIYIVGQSNSATGTIIATTGSHQSANAGAHDAFVAKFNSDGVRQWASYYGGAGDDVGNACAVDKITGDVYIGGATNSTGTVMATVGSHQINHGGATGDAFIAKFNTNGIRQWATYYGGTGNDNIRGMVLDASGNVVAAGLTNSSNGTSIATAGAHQTVFGGGSNDAFVVKFNSSGVRQWGSYYGGTGEDRGFSCDVNTSGDVFLFGDAVSATGTVIATPGSHQPTHGGGYDGFIAKFNGTGVRQWGTYYGGTGLEYEPVGRVDNNGNIYLSGYTNSNTGTVIATPGTHAPTYMGPNTLNNSYLVKFNSNGTRLWGTYHGSAASHDYPGRSFDVDENGYIFFGGFTQSAGTDGYATTGVHQTTHAGGDEGFLIAIRPNGTKAWGTYYGGSGNDQVWGVHYSNGTIYMFGQTGTSTGTGIASVGAHQTTYNGGAEGFLTKFAYEASALRFDNVDDVVNTGTAMGTALVGTNKITVEAWVRPTSNSGLDCIIGNYSTPNNQMQFLLRKENMTNYRFWIGNSALASYTSVASATAPTLNVWQHVAGVFNGSVATIYINGVFSASTTINLPAFNALTNSVVIGGNGINENFGGDMDEIRVWNKALCQGEIMNNMNNEIQTPQANLLAYYKFNQGLAFMNNSTVTTVADSGPNAYTGTITNIALTGTLSNWINTGAVASGVNASSFVSPTISISGNAIICSGNSTTLTANGNVSTYNWVSGPAAASNVVSPSVATTYSVTGTNSLGCISNMATQAVTVNITPTVSVNNGTICAGNSFTINPSGASTYTIEGGNAVVSPSANTSYTVRGTSAAGCISANTATSNLTVNATPIISAGNGTICSGNSFTITPSGAATYTIEGGNAVVSPTTNTSYTIVGTSSAGCLSSNTATSDVAVNPIPNVTAASNTTLICIGQSATLTASGADSYTWNTASSNTSIVVSPTATTVYTVTGVDANGCENTAVVSQNVSACTGINESIDQTSFVQIYPNPASNVLNIKLSGFDLNSTSLKITNILGQDVINTSVSNDQLELNLSNMPNGMYFVRVLVNNKEVVNHKLIKH
jgi:hypothetical protein